ncbi:MAG: hypothetical protein IT334_08355 [Thermomicrobiales bacterium]|nr:hypothetical protein [Thermomicrobiales bacterium]
MQPFSLSRGMPGCPIWLTMAGKLPLAADLMLQAGLKRSNAMISISEVDSSMVDTPGSVEEENEG